MARRAAVRASDLDRERVAEHLRCATAEGRIGADELEDRLGAAFSARTYRQLNAVVSDLPAQPAEQEPIPVWATASLGVAGAVGLMAAAATAAVIFGGIAGVSMAWAFVGRVFFGRRRPARRSASPDLPVALRRQLAARRQIAAQSVPAVRRRS